MRDIIDGRQSALEARRRAGLYMEVAGSDGTLHRYLHLSKSPSRRDSECSAISASRRSRERICTSRSDKGIAEPGSLSFLTSANDNTQGEAMDLPISAWSHDPHHHRQHRNSDGQRHL